MNTPLPLDDEALLKVNAMSKLRKLLQRENRIWQSVAYQRTGTGLTKADFDFCVRMLVTLGFCTVETGERSAPTIVINPDWANTRAEKIITHAMT
jgi:hypothetical protein